MGKVESSTDGNYKAALIKYTNFENGSRPLIEVEIRSNDRYILVKGDQVSFRLESKHENPTNKRAVHVVVTKEVDRTHKGVVNSLDENSEYGQIEYVDRGGKKHEIFFYLIDWFDPSQTIDIYPSLNVEFNILECANQSKRAVRIRPLTLPLTKEQRHKLEKEKEQKAKAKQQELRQKMLREHYEASNDISAQNKKNQKSAKQRKKPPVLSNRMLISQKDNVSVDNSNKSLSKSNRRRMRKKKTKIIKSPLIKASNQQLTQANIDENELAINKQSKVDIGVKEHINLRN